MPHEESMHPGPGRPVNRVWEGVGDGDGVGAGAGVAVGVGMGVAAEKDWGGVGRIDGGLWRSVINQKGAF